MQDRCRRISCARCLCARSPQQDPVGLLVQDHCMRISCAYLCVRLCIRILFVHLCKISVCGSLVQDLSVRISTAAFRATGTHGLRKGLHFQIRRRNFTSLSRDGLTRSPQRVALRNQKAQIYQHFARWTRTIFAEGCTSKSENAILVRSTRTISAEGCTSKSENATLPAFRALDTRSAHKWASKRGSKKLLWFYWRGAYCLAEGPE